MRFSTLIEGLDVEVLQTGDAEITAIETNDLRVHAGTLFLARTGASFDANLVLDRVVGQGAAAVIVTRRDAPLPTGVPVVYAREPERVLGHVSARFFGYPTRQMRVFGVTGTNGKTSVTHLVERALLAMGSRVAIIGTVGYRFDGKTRPAPNTTPDGVTLQAFAREVLDAGADTLVMEVSSHALELGRIAGVAFDVVAITNITPDHLDFHGTFENYRATKTRLFTDVASDSIAAGKSPIAVINVDDLEAAAIVSLVDPRVPVVRVSSSDAVADLVVRATRNHGSTQLAVTTATLSVSGETPMTGSHNVSNIGVALAVVDSLVAGSIAGALAALRDFNGAPGRMEPAYHARANEPRVTVDYAHTPDAVARVVAAFADEPRLAVVLGCGGDRDATKRPAMARAAMAAAHVFITADNPRSESVESIIAQMLQGVDPRDVSRVTTIADRTEAIEAAMRSGATHVLVLGKGHENTQEIAGQKFSANDAEEARRTAMAMERGQASADVPLLCGWSASRIAASVGGTLVHAGALRPLGALRFDSRDVGRGDIFAALPGSRVDGHAFVSRAVAAGAALALVTHVPDGVALGECAAIVVGDVGEALLRLAAAIVDEARARRGGLRIVGITGSSGKTTTKELVAVAIRALVGREPLVTAGNHNNELGVPLTLSRLTPRHREAVVEMGARFMGDIHRLASVTRHEVGVVTSIGPAHLETMGGTLTHVRKTKAGIGAGRPPEVVVMPATEFAHPDWNGLLDDRTRVVTVGTHDASVCVERHGVDGAVRLVADATMGGTVLASLELPLAGLHNALNLGTAVAAAALVAADGEIRGADALNALLRTVELPGGRLERLVIGGRRVVNDAYNANPASMRASLAILAAEPGERWAVLGDMFELGEAEAALHREVGEVAAKSADRVVAIGERARLIADGAGDGAMWFASVDEGVAALCGTVPYGAVIWLKASRAMALERIVDKLRSCWEQPGEGA